jgi:sec-independent protein translocase protein TatA
MGGPELLLILAIVVLLFGAKKLPDLAKSLGGAIKGFKKSMAEQDPSEDATVESSPPKKVEQLRASTGAASAGAPAERQTVTSEKQDRQA